MKVVKPLRLGVTHRVFEAQGRLFLAVGVYAYFAFDRPDRLLPEVEMWRSVPPLLGREAPLDEGMPKPNAEVTVHGHAFTPGDEPQPACKVRLALGPVDKSLYVIGDRHWVRGVATEPEPFESMPVDWAHAFGGKGVADNPSGMGSAPVAREGGETVHPLPNVEDPQALVGSPNAKPKAAGFGALSPTSPRRTAYTGTYDGAWQTHRAPAAPDDFDMHFHQSAPADQWIPQLAAGESFVIENMHAEQATLESRLPAWQARCFVDTGLGLDEVPMRPETVRLFPNAQRGLLIHRGVVEVTEHDAADVSHLVIGADAVDAPRSLDHYQEVLDLRLDRDRAGLYLLRDRDLLPEAAIDGADLAPPPEHAKLAGDGSFARNLRARAKRELTETRAKLEAQGIDPDAAGVPAEPPAPEAAPTIDELPDFYDAKMAEAKAREAEMQQRREAAEKTARAQAEAQGLDYDALVAQAKAESGSEGGGPPAFRAQKQLDEMREAYQAALKTGVAVPQLEAQLADPGLFEKLHALETRLLETYRRHALHFPEATPPPGARRMMRRDQVIHAHQSGTPLGAVDLTGAQLAGLDLAGVDLEGAFLEGADLSGANLTGANLTSTVLARATLDGATLDGATLRRTNFGGASLRGVSASGGVDATGAIFTKADLEGARLDGADLGDADLAEARLVGCDLSGARASGALFLKTALEGVRFAGAMLRKCQFIEVDADGADFSGVDMTDTAFLASSAEGASFVGAQLASLRLVRFCRFAGATFAGAQLEGANLRGNDLVGANFAGAQLEKADLSESKLEGARFALARAHGSMWVRADLRDADLWGLDALMAVFTKASLEGARLDHANFFRADLSRVSVDGGTTLEGANLMQSTFRSAPAAAPEDA